MASAVSFILAVAIANAFFYSSKSLAQTTGRMEMVRAARIPMDRLQQIVAAAVSIPGEDTILYPPTPTITAQLNERGQTVVLDDPDTWYRYAILRTTEDLLSETFDQNEIYNLASMPPVERENLVSRYRTDAQMVYDYILWFEDDAFNDRIPDLDKALVIARIEQVLEFGNTVYRTDAWAAGDPWADIEATAGGALNYRILARNVEDMSFLNRTHALATSVLTESVIEAANGKQEKTFRLEAWLQVPSVSTE